MTATPRSDPSNEGVRMTESQRPVRQVRRGMIQAAIWRNQAENGNTFYTTTFERLYVDDGGEWKYTHGYSRDDLLLLGHVAGLALDEVFELQEADRTEQKRTNGSGGSSAPTLAARGIRNGSKSNGDADSMARQAAKRETRSRFEALAALVSQRIASLRFRVSWQALRLAAR